MFFYLILLVENFESVANELGGIIGDARKVQLEPANDILPNEFY